ncbi:MAG TPA: hypothetical protein VLG16_01280 [Candidatus Saccharimonadales bacterium]|nr:hypothetical protein [Candidatus Saccharimonadales bacterium]
MRKIKNHNSRSPKKKTVWIIILCLVLAAAVMAMLELTNTTHLFHKSSLVKPAKHGSASQNTKGETGSASGVTETQNTSGQSGSTGSGSQPGDQKSDSGGSGTPSSNVTLATPTGDFVSNHHPNLSGQPAPNTMSSTCTTTSGASCKITFTNTSTGEVQSLPSETTDRGGSAYWVWKLQDIQLTQGTWQVKAIATLSGQTQTATDAMNLEVQQ